MTGRRRENAPTSEFDIGRFMTNDFLTTNRSQEDPTVFHARFSRSYRLLHFIACRILGGPEQAKDAIENCWWTASRHPPRFQYEGAFRGWLLRVLMDESLAILHHREEKDGEIFHDVQRNVRIQKRGFPGNASARAATSMCRSVSDIAFPVPRHRESHDFTD